MFKWCPWADALFALDIPWWDRYSEWVSDAFGGRCYAGGANGLGIEPTPAMHYANSGTGAIALAAHFGCEQIIVLGADCSVGLGGEIHCHGDHPAGLGNAGSMDEWPDKYARCARALKPRRVINASSHTALTCWPKLTLDEALKEAEQYLSLVPTLPQA